MELKGKIWYLENYDLFSGLPESEMDWFMQHIELKGYKKGDSIYFEDEAPNAVYFLKAGKVKVGNYSAEGKENVSAILNSGELFGELLLSGDDSHREFAEVLDNETCICVIKPSGLEAFMERNPKLGVKVTKLIGLRLRKAERKLQSLLFKDSRTRIVDFIREMGEESGEKIGYETLVKHNFTHQDIANLTATSRQTVTIVLNELKSKNLIHFERKRILIRDIAELK